METELHTRLSGRDRRYGGFRKNQKICQTHLPKKENARPCVIHSQEEMIAKVREAEAQVERGEYITDEELSKEIETWFRCHA